MRIVGAAAVCAFSVGCLDAPPTYEAPRQIPPAIVESRVEPPLNAIVEILAGKFMTFSVPFHSEDLGETVVAQVYIDIEPGKRPSPLFDEPIPVAASTYDDDTRSFNGRLDAEDFGESGCHSVTLIASHVSNFGVTLADEAKADRIVWWVNLRDPDASKPLLEDCISQGVEAIP